MAASVVVAGLLSGAAVTAVGLWPGLPEPFTGTGTGAESQPRSDGPTPSLGLAAADPGRGPVVRAADVLRSWDRHRAQAWAEGDVAGLRKLYVDRAGVADVRLLRRYTERGYRVEGLTTQLLAVEVLERRAGHWRLRVTDRLADAVALRGVERVRLLRDRADTHVVTLVRGTEGRWQVAEVRAV